MVLGQPNPQTKDGSWNSHSTPHTEINSKVIKDLNAMTKTITFVEEKPGIVLCDLRLGSDFLDMI